MTDVFGGCDCTVWWWLRSPGINPHNAANVNDDGNVNLNGNNVNNSSGGVRPALLPFARSCFARADSLCLEDKGIAFLLVPFHGAGKNMPAVRGTQDIRACFPGFGKGLGPACPFPCR
ncbi:MAG: DUF6273 domain-containing protein [Oscillospiraceae bacterium]|nr:DUF6273 domain-containing protein [Oscillospiraceae bacterium]